MHHFVFVGTVALPAEAFPGNCLPLSAVPPRVLFITRMCNVLVVYLCVYAYDGTSPSKTIRGIRNNPRMCTIRGTPHSPSI